MVEGDLVDLTLPSLLQVMSRECSTAILRLHRGDNNGAMYFAEGVLVHAVAGPVTGDEAACELLGWPDGRFRLARDAEPQPRTITDRLARLVIDVDTTRPGAGPMPGGSGAERSGDEQLLHDLLTQLTRLEQDTTRLQEGQVEGGTVAALLLVTAVVNSMVALVTARCSDPGVLPSHVLPRLAEDHPYTQLLGEDRDRISVATAAGVLKSWKNGTESREQLYLEMCRALLDVLTFYGNTASTFFKSGREREEWRATFALFVDGLTEAINKVEEPKVDAPEAEPARERSKGEKAMTRGHVLVVDDSPTGRQAASNLLKRGGYEVRTAVDGEEALEKIAAAPPPVVVLDIVLPKMNGYQVLRQLKASDTTRGIKVILVSSKSQESDRFWGLKQGADDYIAKPYLDATLLAAVKRQL